MIDIAVTVDPSDALTGLEALAHKARALGPVMTSLVKPLRDDQRNHKRARSGSAAAWQPLAASTIANARAHGKRKTARSLLGKLPTAVSYKATADSVTGTSRVAWSSAHQDGATVGHGAHLPAREFLWISDEMQVLADREIGAALVDAFGGGK